VSRPTRIQLSRRKGYHKPDGAVKVDRSTAFGNPFRPILISPEACVRSFRSWLLDDSGRLGHEERRAKLLARLPELRGKDLACWCKPGAACHADVLLELANEAGP
jgi:hypothetical protein